METKVLSFTDNECLEIVKNNQVLAFPTETVFGFGVIYDSKEAFDNMCTLKGRAPDKPFTIMLSKKEDIHEFVEVTEKMQKLIDKFMPGEVTFLFPIKKGLYPWLSLNQPTVGIRISASKDVCDLIQRVGKPMLVTSANMSHEPAMTSYSEVLEKFNSKIEGVVKGECTSLMPSTIVLIGEELKLIRQGSISFEEIIKEWNI